MVVALGQFADFDIAATLSAPAYAFPRGRYDGRDVLVKQFETGELIAHER